jgi:GTP-binding protein EngB required for normal cell division/archaellum component FlaC
MSIQKLDQIRSIMVLGKTGVGKSTILNEIIGKHVFEGSSDVKSSTKKIESNLSLVNFKVSTEDKSQEITPFHLKVIDTPGFDDSNGRSLKFINEIALNILKEPLNLIILIVEFGRFSTSLQNNLEILRECLNDFSISSTMIIINKVPSEKTLKKKHRDGEMVRDRKELLEEIFEKYSKALGCSFKYRFFLENHDYAENINEETYNIIKGVIYSCNIFIDTSKVRTWDEIVEMYSRNKSTSNEQELNELMKFILDEIEDKISKIEFEIADIKYSFLRSKHLMSNTFLNSHKEFVSDFECAITEEDYSKKKNLPLEKLAKVATVSGTVGTVGATLGGITGAILVGAGASIAPIVLPLSFILGFSTSLIFTSDIVFHKNYKNIREKLTSLGERRDELRGELRKCQSSIEEQKKKLYERKEKINRLESALVTQAQDSTY